MTEEEFWDALEYRVSHELRLMDNPQLQCLWCDSFIAERYEPAIAEPCITGRAWICRGSEQKEWTFKLVLPEQWDSAELIRWDTILPPDEKSWWISLDFRNRTLHLDPASAANSDL